MVIIKGKFSYAKQFLREQGIRIVDMDDGFEYSDLYPLYKNKPHFYVNPNLKTNLEIRNIENYDDLKRLGFLVVSRTPDNPWFDGQKVEFDIVRQAYANYAVADYGTIPKGHLVSYDLTNKRARIEGKNSLRKWRYLFPPTKERRHEFDAHDFSQMERERRKYYDTIMPIQEEEEPIRIDISELPVMRTPTHIICIEEDGNEPTIGIVGEKGFGKSFDLNAISSHARHLWNKRIVILNDRTRECGPWCLPWDAQSEFSYELMGIGEQSIPSPMAYLHLEGDPPLTNILNEGETGYTFSIAFKDLILDYENLLKGSKRWQFKNSGTWFRNLLFKPDGTPDEELLNAVNLMEIRAVVEKKIKQKSIQEKIISVLSDIYNRRILDISNDVKSYWTLEDKNDEKLKFKPWIACLYANLVPCIETYSFESKDYFPQVMKMIAEDIIYAQTKIDYFVKNKIQIWCMIDEITGIARKGKETVASDVLQRLVTEGRPVRIGTVYCTQDYKYVFDRIRENTNYLFCFHQKEINLKEIASDFPMPKDIRSDLKHLNSFEVVGLTSKKFITYDVRTGKREETKEPIKGVSIPPLNQHQRPREYMKPVVT